VVFWFWEEIPKRKEKVVTVHARGRALVSRYFITKNTEKGGDWEVLPIGALFWEYRIQMQKGGPTKQTNSFGN